MDRACRLVRLPVSTARPRVLEFRLQLRLAKTDPEAHSYCPLSNTPQVEENGGNGLRQAWA
jgi:hypothetical protein